MQGPGSLAMDKEDINQVGDQFSHLIRHVNDQGGGDAPCPIVFGELQLGVRRRRKEEGEGAFGFHRFQRSGLSYGAC